MRVKVIINNGVIENVLMDQEAVDAEVDVEIVDYDNDISSSECFKKVMDNFSREGLRDASFSIEHCDNSNE